MTPVYNSTVPVSTLQATEKHLILGMDNSNTVYIDRTTDMYDAAIKNTK
jgi:hypothetical protein